MPWTKEQRSEYMRCWNEANPTYHKDYYQRKKKELVESRRVYMRSYYLQHQDKLKQQAKNYYQTNREEILSRYTRDPTYRKRVLEACRRYQSRKKFPELAERPLTRARKRKTRTKADDNGDGDGADRPTISVTTSTNKKEEMLGSWQSNRALKDSENGMAIGRIKNKNVKMQKISNVNEVELNVSKSKKSNSSRKPEDLKRVKEARAVVKKIGRVSLSP